MPSIKETFRRQLARRGWFLRKIAGLPAGVDFEHDFFVTAGLPQPRIVFDVGGHHGETAGPFSRSFPAARILSFEPVHDNFAVLSERARAWPNVECHQLAFGNRTEKVSIVLQSDSQTHTLKAHAGTSPDPGQRCETVNVTTLDEFTAGRQIAGIDLLKIDTEGHELAVFDGARRLLDRHRIGPILFEASLDPTDTTHTPLPEATAFLRPFGYELAAIYDQVVWRRPTRLAYFNALFVPATLPDPGTPAHP
jgi:FkbM family methyltransferase